MKGSDGKPFDMSTILKQAYLPKETEKWVEVLKNEDVFGLRRLLKKQRQDLPSKYKRLFMASDEKLMILLHYMRSEYPFFTKQEKERSENFLKIKDMEARGEVFDPGKLH